MDKSNYPESFIEEIINNGNFWFVEQYNDKLYYELYSAEKKSYLDYKGSGNHFRKALEILIEKIICDYKLESIIDSDKKNLDLDSKIRMLNNNSILPQTGNVKFIDNSGKEKYKDSYTFLRWLGNSSSHVEQKDFWPKINYTNILNALKIFHKICIGYFLDEKLYQKMNFKDKHIPIGKYYIKDSYVPKDSARSKCIRESLGFTKDNYGEKLFYSIIRVYKKSDIYKEFLIRNHEVFVETARNSFTGGFEGLTRIEELTEYSSENKSFYIIAYEFNRKPVQINDSILKTLNLKDRLEVCKKIADCFLSLHKLDKPIYHRMISYESIYICDYENRFVPYVINFDFAKIDANNKKTVLLNALDAKSKLQELKVIKYLSPEWSQTNVEKNIDWSKVDLYALGILFVDIIKGSVDCGVTQIEELEELDLTEELLDLLDNLRADSPQLRPDISIVQSVLDREVKRWI